MGKQTGLGDNFYIAGYDISGDVQSISRIGGGPMALEMTGIDKSAFERQGGLRDGGMAFVTYFNDATGQAVPVLKGRPTTDVIAAYCRGTTLGNPGAACVAKQLNFDPNQGNDGSLTFTVDIQSTLYGLEWGKQLTAGKRTDTGAANGTGVDFGVGSTTFGLQAFLQVFSLTGTNVDVKLQESSDNGAGDAWVDVTGGAFASVTAAPAVERIQTARDLTVERYLRVVTSGVFTSAVFNVIVVRNDTSVVF